MDNPDFPWSLDTETLQTAYNTDVTLGLDTAAAEKRLSESGVNSIKESRKLTFWSILFAELKDPLIIVTLIIGVIYSIWGQIGDTLTIICLILVVTFVEVYTEFKAKKSIDNFVRVPHETINAVNMFAVFFSNKLYPQRKRRAVCTGGVNTAG